METVAAVRMNAKNRINVIVIVKDQEMMTVFRLADQETMTVLRLADQEMMTVFRLADQEMMTVFRLADQETMTVLRLADRVLSRTFPIQGCADVKNGKNIAIEKYAIV